MRATLFFNWPGAVLFCAEEGEQSIVVPSELALPLSKESVANAIAKTGVEPRVMQTASGGWTAALTAAKNAEKSERAQKQKLREATESAVLRGSVSTLVRSHAEATVKKHEIDESIRVLKEQIGEAKKRAFTRGVYEDPRTFRGRESRLAALQLESQALQVRMGELPTQGETGQ